MGFGMVYCMLESVLFQDFQGQQKRMVLKDKGLRKKNILLVYRRHCQIEYVFSWIGKRSRAFLFSSKRKAQESYCALLGKAFSEVDKSNFHWRQIVECFYRFLFTFDLLSDASSAPLVDPISFLYLLDAPATNVSASHLGCVWL